MSNAKVYYAPVSLQTYAEVVELVDTLASGASARKGVEVQVLFSAPLQLNIFLTLGSE